MLKNRLRYFLAGRQWERDLAEELECHRQMVEERTGSAATSRRVMGNATLAREDAREVWIAPWIDGVRQDIAYALRVLRRAPGFAAGMIAVTALGIGATTSVFGLIDGIVLKSLPVREPHRLVYFSRPSFSYPVLLEVRARSTDVFDSVAGWNMERFHVAWNTELEPAEVLMASGNFFSTLGIGAAVGRTFDPEDDRIGGGREGLVAVITHAAWERRLNRDPAVVGRSIRIDQHVFTIVGVTPPDFFGVAPGLAPELMVPLTSTADPGRLGSATGSSTHLLGRLRDDVDLDQANVALRTFWPAVLDATLDRQMPPGRRAEHLGRTTTLESGRAGYSRVRNQFQQPLWMLLSLGTLLLAVSCASAANLLLARGVARQRETAVRVAIGAGRARLVRQMLTESLVWTVLGAAVGLMLALWGAGALVAMMTTSQEEIVVDLTLNWRILAFSIALAFVTASLCSLLPALGATRLDPASSLKDTGQIGTAVLRRTRAGITLVAAQAAVTVLLLFGASLFTRSLVRVLEQDAGVERRNLLVLSIDAEAAGYEGDRLAHFYDQLRQRLGRIPGVQSVSVSLYPPISDEDGAWTQNIAVDGDPDPEAPGSPAAYFNAVSPGYFRTTGTALVAGRDFGPDDTASAPHVAIVNEALARRLFAGQPALGRSITAGRGASRRELQIVGMVRDAKYQRLDERASSIVYLPHTQHPVENLFAEVRATGHLAQATDSIRREVRSLDPAVPLRIESVADRIRESLVTERVMTYLAIALGCIALALACAGLYGMLAFAVTNRRREIGLRLALGAARSDVLRMVLAQSLTLVGPGILAGIGAALLLGRFASGRLYEVSPRDPLSLLAAACIMLAVAFLSAVVPARRAAHVDPAVALRSE